MRREIHASKGLSFWLLLAGSGAVASGAHAECACTAMTVDRDASTRFEVCSNFELKDIVNDDECVRDDGSKANHCEDFTYHFACRLGVNSKHYTGDRPFFQRTGVGVVASITGEPGDCHSGLLLQEKITDNSSLRKNPTRGKIPKWSEGPVDIGDWKVNILDAPGQMPQLNAKSDGRQDFGADNYSNSNSDEVLIESSNGHTKWWDNTDQTRGTKR